MDGGPDSQLPDYRPGSQPPQVKFDFASGGWVLLLAGILGIWLFLHLTWPLLTGKAKPEPVVATPEELGYDMSTCLVPRDQVVYGAPADSIPPLVMPKTFLGKDAAEITKEYRRKYHHKFVVTGDRVVGVTINGESRAYQLKILQWHEVANDGLGGVPIAVTYSPLTDSVAVFDRTSPDGVPMLYASSGFLYQSNSLFYDLNPIHGHAMSSLWSQLGHKAITWQEAQDGWQFTPLPCELTHWGDWLARHPDTTLLSDETGVERDYYQNAYGPYYDRMKLRFPVAGLPADASVEQLFQRAIAVKLPGGWQAWTYEQIKAQPVQDGLTFVYEPYAAGMQPDTVRLVSDAPFPVVYGLWFALQAFGYAPTYAAPAR